MKKISISILILFISISCGGLPQQPAAPDITTTLPQPNISNPASVYCEQEGNQLEIRTGTDGSQAGMCIFPDGSQCEEWAYFRSECSPGTSEPIVENKAVEAAKIRLAQQLSIDPGTIDVYSVERVIWPNSCLGVPAPAETCNWVETPGFRVILTVNGDYHTYHTDLLGENIQEETAGTRPY